MKKTLSFLLSVVMIVTFMCGSITVYAEETPTASLPAIENNVSIKGTNSFGNLLSEALTEESDRQEENNGYNVFSAEVTGNVATVEYETLVDCKLLVAVYDEEGKTLLTSGQAEISKDETISKVRIETDSMPEYFYLRVFMIDSDDLSPMCTVYESPNYTKEMQEFFAKTVDDFEADKVLNLDNDKTNNFAVYSDGVKTIESDGTVNVFTTIDEENEKYIIKNADNSVKSLKKGDIFVYEYDNGSLLIVDVGKISISGTTVTITGQDTAMEKVFDYVKIDSTKNSVPAPQALPNVLKPSIKAIEATSKASASAELTLVNETFVGDDKNNVKLNGSVKFDATASVKYYISFSYAYLELKIDFSASISVSVTGKINKSIPFTKAMGMTPIPGVFIEVTPSFVFKADAKIAIDATLKGTVGFNVNTNTGIKNLTTAKLSSEIAIDGTIFLGFSLEPKVKIISDNVAKTSVIAQVGGEIKASYKKEIASTNTSESSHVCKNCLDGDISGKLDGSFNVTLLNKRSFKLNLPNLTIKIGDFYYSLDFKEFGWGTCPHQKDAEYVGEIIQSGNCGVAGDNVIYELYENGTLRIFGTGKMKNGSGIFKKTDKIKKAIIENGVTQIGENNFRGLSKLESIKIPDSVTYIEVGAFFGCGLKSIVLPENIEEINEGTFNSCVSLTSVSIPDSVETIGSHAFNGCVSLTSISIPDSVETIDYCAFMGCEELESIKIPDGVTFIKYSTFENCKKLKSITIPKSVTSIESEAFEGCKRFKDVYYTGTKQEWEKIDISYGNGYLTKATIHYNSTGTETLSLSPQAISINAPEKTTPLKNLLPDTIYNVYVFRSKNVKNLIASGNLLYVMQFRTDSNGNINATDMPDGEISFVRMKCNIILGDANNDSELNIADAIMLQKWLLGTGNLTNWCNVDLCEDGVIDSFDMVMMRKLLTEKL